MAIVQASRSKLVHNQTNASLVNKDFKLAGVIAWGQPHMFNVSIGAMLMCSIKRASIPGVEVFVENS
jgi:hypothetical protein